MAVYSERDDDEIYVRTVSSVGEYEYWFEKVDFAWLLVKKVVDGEEEEVTDDTRLSKTVRDEVKSLDKGFISMVTTNQFWKEIRDTDPDDILEDLDLTRDDLKSYGEEREW